MLTADEYAARAEQEVATKTMSGIEKAKVFAMLALTAELREFNEGRSR